VRQSPRNTAGRKVRTLPRNFCGEPGSGSDARKRSEPRLSAKAETSGVTPARRKARDANRDGLIRKD